jgi:hypothetical protein
MRFRYSIQAMIAAMGLGAALLAAMRTQAGAASRAKPGVRVFAAQTSPQTGPQRTADTQQFATGNPSRPHVKTFEPSAP